MLYGSDDQQKIKELLSQYIDQGFDVIFEEVDNPVFSTNLRMVDSLLPEILAHLLINYYSSIGTSIKDLTQALIQNDR